MRYTHRFHIDPVVESSESNDIVFEVDLTKERVYFIGRLKPVTPDSAGVFSGDLTKATHTVAIPALGYKFQIGEKIVCDNDKLEYEILLISVGQRSIKLWVALT